MSWTITKEILITGVVVWFMVLLVLARNHQSDDGGRCHPLVKSFLVCLPIWALCIPYKLGIPPVTSTLFTWGLAALIILSIPVELIIFLDYFAEARVALLTITAQLCLSGALFIFPFVCTYVMGRQAFTNYLEAHPFQSINCPTNASQVLTAHISDSHLLENPELRTAEGDLPGNERLKELIASITNYKPAYLLHSGDITDTGSAKEWSQAVGILKPVTSWARIILSPGNHDVSEALCARALPECASDTYHERVHLWRFFNAQAELFPEIKTASGRSLREELDRRDFHTDIRQVAIAQSLINKCTKDCQDVHEPGKYRALAFGPCKRSCEKKHPSEAQLMDEFPKNEGIWRENGLDLFPLWWADEERSIAIFSLEISPLPGREIGKNAIGFIDKGQVKRLKEIFGKLPQTIHTVIILCHHPLTRAPGDTFSGPENLLSWADWQNSQWWAYALLRATPDDADEVVTWLMQTAEARPDISMVLAFGHRHRRSLGTIGRVTLEEAPNVSNGLYDKGVFFISREPNNLVGAAWCEMVK